VSALVTPEEVKEIDRFWKSNKTKAKNKILIELQAAIELFDKVGRSQLADKVVEMAMETLKAQGSTSDENRL